jgi:ribosomal-protein-alanine N-acetyltransferase
VWLSFQKALGRERSAPHIVGNVNERWLSDGGLLLRPPTDADAPAIVEAIDGDEQISLWLDLIPQPYNLEHALGWLRGDAGRGESELKWALTEEGRFLGTIGATPQGDDVWEVGYWIRAEARGRGLMPRALELVARWLLAERHAKRIYLRADPENAASCRVAEKAGFTNEGVLRSAHWNERLGRRQSWTIYSLLPTDAS